ncbi:MAG: flagellar hook-length control protein FliK [Methylophilaceae bacterium]|nr:flagellar hook-length control protein FliK [Methylophilaceae bacterium]
MIHNDIQNQLALLVKTSAPPLIEVADSPIETPQWVPGQRLPAHVIASLPNGRFQVEVGDQILDMNLPRNTQPGQTIELTFLSNTPRPTFALTQELARTLPPGSGVSLSEAAKFLGALMQRGNAAAPTASQATSPIMPGPPLDTADFAAALQAAISRSGLFYESHQAQWVVGERTLPSLLQEPQGRLSPLIQAQGKIPSEAVSAAITGQSSPPLSESSSEWQVPSHQQTSRSDSLPVHPSAQPLVLRQLESLDSGQMVWQGQVWPGQDMHWEIEEDGARHGQQEEADKPWRTRLRLELPSLGSVTAQLVVAGSRVRVDFAAERDATVNLLREALDNLRQAMAAAGLRVEGMEVHGGG